MKNQKERQERWKPFLWTRGSWLLKWLSSLPQTPCTMIQRDWQADKYFPLAMISLVWTSVVVITYYLNHPQPEPLADSWSYLYVVNQIQHHGQMVNFWRLPGYPFLIYFIYTLAGQGNLGAVSIAQGMLFIFSTLELYILGALILRRSWIAFLLSLFVGADVVILSNVKPIMTEGLALWLLITLALAVTLFLHTLRLRFFWPVVLCTLLLFFTRPEWIYLPPFLFAYLLLVIYWRGVQRRFIVPTLLATLLLYGFLGSYTLLNTIQNNFNGVTWIQNINLLGKVLQYQMEDESSPQDAEISRILDTYTKRGITDPYIILSQQPVLASNYATRSGEFAKQIILHHPVEFVLKSTPIFFSSLTDFHLQSTVQTDGPFGAPLKWLQNEFHAFYYYNILFPLCALIWILLMCIRKMRRHDMVQKMGAVVLLVLYGIIVTTLAAYRSIDYARIYTLLNPLLFLIIGGTFLAPFLLLWPGKLRFISGAGNKVKKESKAVQMAHNGVVIHQPKSLTKNAFKYKTRVLLATLFVLLAIVLLVIRSSNVPVAHVSPHVVPLACHKETDSGMLHGNGVGILFITVENTSQYVAPATMQVEFKTSSTIVPQVMLNVVIPALPSGAQRLIMVDIPKAPQDSSFLNPVGQIKISLNLPQGKELANVKQADSVLITHC